jgi:hypothetical protein
VKCWAKIAALLLCVAAVGRTQGTHGTWIDPSTGLMWAGRDNGKDVSWKNAAKYCRNFRLAGYSDWRLATVAELKIIYDRSANAPGLSGPDNGPSTWHVKGNLFLTGYQWSSERRNDGSRPSYRLRVVLRLQRRKIEQPANRFSVLALFYARIVCTWFRKMRKLKPERDGTFPTQWILPGNSYLPWMEMERITNFSQWVRCLGQPAAEERYKMRRRGPDGYR